MALAVAGICLAVFAIKAEHLRKLLNCHGARKCSNPYGWAICCWGAGVCEAAYSVIGKKLTGTLGRRITSLINLWVLRCPPLLALLPRQFDFASVGPGILLLLFYALAACIAGRCG